MGLSSSSSTEGQVIIFADACCISVPNNASPDAVYDQLTSFRNENDVPSENRVIIVFARDLPSTFRRILNSIGVRVVELNLADGKAFRSDFFDTFDTNYSKRRVNMTVAITDSFEFLDTIEGSINGRSTIKRLSGANIFSRVPPSGADCVSAPKSAKQSLNQFAAVPCRFQDACLKRSTCPFLHRSGLKNTVKTPLIHQAPASIRSPNSRFRSPSDYQELVNVLKLAPENAIKMTALGSICKPLVNRLGFTKLHELITAAVEAGVVTTRGPLYGCPGAECIVSLPRSHDSAIQGWANQAVFSEPENRTWNEVWRLRAC